MVGVGYIRRDRIKVIKLEDAIDIADGIAKLVLSFVNLCFFSSSIGHFD